MKHIRLWTAFAVSLLAQAALAQSSSSSSQTSAASNASNAGANSSTNTSTATSTQNAVSGSTASNNNSQNNGSASSVNATFTIVNPAAAPAAAAPASGSSLQSSSNPETVLKQNVTGETYSYGEQRTYVEYGGTQTIKNVPSIAAPPLASSNDTCMGSASGGLAVAGFGITGGGTYTDEHCKRIKMSRELWNKGMKAASLAMDCMDRDAREALELTGFVCPQTTRAQKQAAEAQLQAEAAARRGVRVVVTSPPAPVPSAEEQSTVPVASAVSQSAPPVVPPAPAADPPPAAATADPPAPVAAASPSLVRRFAEDAAAASGLRQEAGIVIRRVDDGAALQR